MRQLPLLRSSIVRGEMGYALRTTHNTHRAPSKPLAPLVFDRLWFLLFGKQIACQPCRANLSCKIGTD